MFGAHSMFPGRCHFENLLIPFIRDTRIIIIMEKDIHGYYRNAAAHGSGSGH